MFHPGSKLKGVLIGAGSLLVAWLFIFALGGQSPEYSRTYLIIATTATILIWRGAMVLANRPPWYSPHALLLFGMFIIEVVAPVAVLHYRVPAYVFERPLSPEEFEAATMLGLVGVVSYLIGWALGPKKTTMNRRFEWYLTDTPQVQKNFTLMCFGLYTAGILAWIIMFRTVGGMTEHMENMGGGRREMQGGAGAIVWHLAKFAYVGALLYFSRHGLKPVSIAMILFLGVFLLAFGSRSYAAILFAGAFIIYRVRHTEKIPMVVWGIMASALFFFMTFWALLRRTGGDLSEAAEMYSELKSTQETAILHAVGSWMFIRNRAELIHYMGDKIPWMNGETYLTFFKFIPQFIWPGQNQIISGAQVYMQYLIPHRVGKVSLSSQLFTEFYINFGYPGVIISAMLCGMLIRWFHSRLLADPMRRYQVPHVVLSALLTLCLIRVLKGGIQAMNVPVYFFVGVFLVYLPNLGYLINPPPSDNPASEK